MKYTNFRAMRDEAFQHYQQGEHAQALEIIEENFAEFPDEAALLYNWRICMHAVQGHSERALALLTEALDAGYWWSENLLRADPDLEGLQGNPDFERLASESQARYEQASAEAQPELLVLEPNEAYPAPHPLLIAIHGRNSNAQDLVAIWQPLTREGWIVALPQSSQILMPNAYGWDDRPKAMQELLTHFDNLVEKYTIAPRQIVLSGFSQGGGLAISLATGPDGPTGKFIAIAPYLNDIEDQIPENRSPEARGYLVVGLQDQSMDFQALDDRLQGLKIPYSKELHPDLGHEFPPDFGGTVRRALEYLFEE